MTTEQKISDCELRDGKATTYVVRDAGGDYLGSDGDRTPAGDEAEEFETIEEARSACTRGSDVVYSRQEGRWDRVCK